MKKDVQVDELFKKDVDQINDMFKRLQRSSFSWVDRLSFLNIFLIWLCVIVSFGLIYYFAHNDYSYLYYVLKDRPVDKIPDSIYFSFVTATTTGFGDVIPFGVFKFLSMFEVVFGLMLLAIVTSKLISIKQDVILGELYEFSLTEKSNRLRASLLLFRQNLDRLIVKIEAKDVQKREINAIYVYISSLEDGINETLNLIEKSEVNQFIGKIDPVNAELIFNGILTSFEKLGELISVMDQNKIEWRTDLTLDLTRRCLSLNEELFRRLNASQDLIRREVIKDFNARKNKIDSAIKSSIGSKQA